VVAIIDGIIAAVGAALILYYGFGIGDGRSSSRASGCILRTRAS